MNLTNNVLSIKNVSKTYYSSKGELQSIENISFDAKENDFIAIVGPSGCGKSTLLNIIAALDNEYDGSIIKNNNLKIGYMLQNDSLFEWLTVLENASLGLKIKKTLNNENKKYVNDLLDKYGLRDFKNKKISELSGGMRQRVALIRTLATSPDLILLDEAFSALDYQTRLQVSDDVYNIIKNENKTVIMVTHDLAEAISMANKIFVFSKRPATIKNIYNINLTSSKGPIENRKAKEFSYYYDLLWKDIDKCE